MAKTNREYHVSWEIEVYASSAKEAAKKALAIHRDPTSTATVFDVTPTEGRNAGQTKHIDLEKGNSTVAALDKKHFTYEADAKGYRLFYKGRYIGGANEGGWKEKPLHWRHARANVKMFGEQAQMEIGYLSDGSEQRLMLNDILKEEASHS